MPRVMWLLALVLVTRGAAGDVTASDFYRSLLARGQEAYARGAMQDALKLLHIAAFGSVDDIAAYQRANVYIALASDRVGDAAGATAALVRLSAAERIAPSFATLDIGADAAAFASLSRRYGITMAPPRRDPPSSPARAPGISTETPVQPAPAPQRATVPPPQKPAPSPTRIAPRTEREAAAVPVTPPPPQEKAIAQAVTVQPARPAPSPQADSATGTQTGAAVQKPAAVRTAPPPPVAKPERVAEKTEEHPEIPNEELALQVAIACEQATIDGLRRRLVDVVLVPQALGARTCQRVLTGHFLLREEALDAAEAVQKRAGTADRPLVVVRPAPPPAQDRPRP